MGHPTRCTRSIHGWIHPYLFLLILFSSRLGCEAVKGNLPVCAGDSNFGCDSEASNGPCAKMMQYHINENYRSSWNLRHNFLEKHFRSRCSSMIEIGTARGGLAAHMLEHGNISKWHAVDPFAGGYDITDQTSNDIAVKEKSFGGTASEHLWARSVLTRLSPFGCRYQLHLGFSGDRVDDFEDESYDCLFIDGDHTYEGVSKDIIEYSPKVKKGGFIYFDDVGEQFIGVRRAAFELIIANNLTLHSASKHYNYVVEKPKEGPFDTSWRMPNETVELFPKPPRFGYSTQPIYLGSKENYKSYMLALQGDSGTPTRSKVKMSGKHKLRTESHT